MDNKQALGDKNLGIEVYVVAGNHDYHLLRLDDSKYQFKFYSQLNDFPLIASKKDRKYIFKHGWEFDPLKHPAIMELMCHNMSDEVGVTDSHIYDMLLKIKDGLDRDLKNILENHNQNDKQYLKYLMLPPEERNNISDIEKKAYTSINEDQVLVFGHTHRPLISSDHRVINCGSWVKDAKINNTFVEIEEDNINIFKFEDKNTDPENITGSITWDFKKQ